MPLKNFEDLSDEILDMQSRESERYALLYERLANQNDMTNEEQEALENEVNCEVETLEKTSAKLKKVQKWSSEQADELKTRLNEGKKSENKRRFLRRAPANSVIDYEETKSKNFAAGLNFYKIALICISGSFAGVVVEMLWCLIRNGYIESRAGLVYGPFNLLYGVGAVALTLILYRYRNRSSAFSFIGGIVIGSIVEYVLSWGQETLFGSTSWDYSEIPFNINGRICLLYSVFWGILGVMWIKSIYPRVAKIILKIPNKAGKILTAVLTVFMIFNALMSLCSVWRWSERVHNVPASSAFDEFFDKRFPDSRMERIFANMEFDIED
ncbi:MAG: putative ABC transporter permease [Acutalibacteraceae bacterium]|nr:putative ABC transporter permease [Acutalibacteraceae bacterium]